MAKGGGNEGCGCLILIVIGVIVLNGGSAALGNLVTATIGFGVILQATISDTSLNSWKFRVMSVFS